MYWLLVRLVMSLIVRSKIELGCPRKGNLWDIRFRAAKTLYLMNVPVDQTNSGQNMNLHFLQVCTNFSFSLIDNFLSRSVGQALSRRRRKVAETSAQNRGDVVTICSQAPWSLVGVGVVSLVEKTMRLPLDPNFEFPSDFLKTEANHSIKTVHKH